jgi:hypothetical protein
MALSLVVGLVAGTITLSRLTFLMAPVAGAAHSVSMEQSEEFHRILRDIIVPETYPTAVGRPGMQ